MFSPKCPHCGKSMSQAEITEDYHVVHTCDCKDAETSSRKLRKNPDRSLCAYCGELHEMKYCCGVCNAETCSRDCLEDHFEENHPNHLIANPKASRRNPERNTLNEAERYLLDMTRETHDRFIALALVEAKYGTDIALEVGKKYRIGRERAIVNPGKAKKNPLAGTDAWGHKLFIENPTREELQEIADALQVPVGIQKDLSKEMEIYKRFHHRKPDEIIKVNHPGTPKSLVALGKLKSVIYHKCTDGQDYIHDLKHGLLCSDKTGKLWIIGDKAKITKRGIVG